MTTRRGFSLLEVLFAVALFGAVVTVILSAEAGAVASNRASANISQAITLARCRMTEVEEKQLRLGFPEIEEKDTSSACCDDKDTPGYSCESNVERVKLPEATALGGDAGIGGADLSSLMGMGLDGGAGGLLGAGGPLGGALPGMINPAGGAALDLDAGLQNLGSTMQQSLGGGGASGLLSMAFAIVYPTLKPLLESAIRKLTVKVTWREGHSDREFTLTQYVTNPSRAGLIAGMADAGLGGEGGLPGLGGLFGMPGATGAPGSPLGGGSK
jgi:general secretion pathway protein I